MQLAAPRGLPDSWTPRQSEAEMWAWPVLRPSTCVDPSDMTLPDGVLLLLLLFVITFMQGIYNYVPETNRVYMVYSVATVL